VGQPAKKKANLDFLDSIIAISLQCEATLVKKLLFRLENEEEKLQRRDDEGRLAQ
jgi:hypothetical protein